MDYVRCMIALGLSGEDAKSIYKWFSDRRDFVGLEKYIQDKRHFNAEASDR